MILNKLLNIKYPIIQGAMAHIATGKFAAEVSNSGGLGVVSSAVYNPAEFRQEVRTCKNNTDKPFAVNLLLLHRQIDEIIDVVLSENIKIVTTGAGNPSKYMDKFKAHGIKVMPVVSSVALAKKMAREGAFAIIAEGSEAGGHVGDLSTMALLPQVYEAVDIPVVAAGGIATGRQLLAAKILGACGAQIGTALLATEECPIHESYRDSIVAARSSRVVVIGGTNGYKTQVIKNNMSRKYIAAEKNGKSKEELELYTLGALGRAVKEGDVINGSLMAGQVVGQINHKTNLKTCFQTLMRDYESVKQVICEC
ncbi:MAG: enoyl-[acyl-carrier-protein] reductase FabK [Clostridiales bacterium]|nr:MAG: enoyl-[acyl-carrier-protein] reductase FabK [Clostridiales bacterium]